MDRIDNEPIIIGDLNSGTTLFVDPVTGMLVAPSDDTTDPFTSLTSPTSRARTIHGRAPRSSSPPHAA